MLSLRYWVFVSTSVLILIRFVCMILLIRLGYLILIDDDDHKILNYSPDIQDLGINPEFSISISQA